MDFKDWVYDHPQYGGTWGFKNKPLPIVLGKGSLEGRAEGRKGYIVCVGETCHVDLEFRF